MGDGGWLWARVVRKTPRGRALLLNLFYDYLARPVSHPSFDLFFKYLKKYDNVTGKNLVVGSHTNDARDPEDEIWYFCGSRPAPPNVTRNAPQISSTAFSKFSTNFVRFEAIRQDQRETLVQDSELHIPSASTRHLGVKNQSRDTESYSLAIERQRDLLELARLKDTSQYFVKFFTFEDEIGDVPVSFAGDYMGWVSAKLGLDFGPGIELNRLTYKFTSYASWRPTTFASGGHIGFFAHDDAHEFGLTMPAKGVDYGVFEFVVPEEMLRQAIPSVDIFAAPLRDMSAEIDLERIEATMRQKVRNRL